MTIRTEQVYRLVRQDFGGNLAEFGRALGLSYTTIWRTLNGRSSGTRRFLPALCRYCKQSGRELGQFLDVRS